LALPIEWLHNTETLLVKAAQFKASYPLSIADAWIAACASEHSAVLLHKDPEFKTVPVSQELLPLKSTKMK
jgi:ribonuclease VapC